MIRLNLTRQQTQWLQQLLANQTLDTDVQAATLRTQLALAYNQATATRTCPVCKEPFTQLRCGRTGHYCSPACKQKAYRQRCNAWRRQIPAHPWPD